ncbi:MAG: hypothetical protein JSW39_13030 [Desulfobacterales bacterium]|nr:MAG: hypothetical protein JSW39_13030 [Desulfobacterales bacterium]
MRFWKYPRYVSVGEKRAKAAQKLAQLKKKNPAVQPIVLEGPTLAKTWWGKAWNYNLECYADYSNRIGRGRSYVRHGAVLDLQIAPGQVHSLVQGSRAQPYAVVIKIKGIKKNIWQNMKRACAGQLDSLSELLAGKFPKTIGEIFTVQGQGLFPSPQEIEFDCSCPDWADMCKHVAATLYGIGARLDNDPCLFFKLRKVDMDDLIQQTIKDRTYQLLEKAEKTSTGRIAESDLAGLFGIDMEETPDFDVLQAAATATGAGKTARPTARRAKTKAAPTKPAKKKAARAKPQKLGLQKRAKPAKVQGRLPTAAEKAPAGKKTAGHAAAVQVLKIVKRSKKGVDVATLQRRTGLDAQKIRNVISRAFKAGIITRAGRGIYLGAKR